MAVSLDSLYIADLKVKYPEETYCEMLDYYSAIDKKKYSKIADIKRELERRGEKVYKISMGYVSDRTEKIEGGYIQSMLSVKGTNEKLISFLKTIKETDSPLEVYFKMKDTKIDGKSCGDKRNLKALCRIGFFDNVDSSKKVMEYAPLLYDNIYTKKQFRQASIDKLKEMFKLNDDFDIMKYCSRRTEKTFYLDESKKLQFCNDIYNTLENISFTPVESAINEVKSFGYLVNYAEYKQYGIVDGMIKAISLKTKTITMTSHVTGNDIQVSINGSMTGLKKKINILLLGIRTTGKKIIAQNFITYK